MSETGHRRAKKFCFLAHHAKEMKVCQKRRDIYGTGLKPQKRPT